jgi:4-methyl-5(b-hydroxyethyl)-thiazole monophosphate biosynthesis
MAKAVVLLAEGFEEIEAFTIVDVLRRAGIETIMAGIDGNACVTSAHGVTMQVDAQATDVGDFDLIVLPGGLPGAENLAASPIVMTLITQAKSKDLLIGAICAAPIALEAAGILEPGTTYTCYPGFEDRIANGKHTGAMVEIDGKLITGAGPGAALEFSYALLENLGCGATVDELRKGMLAPPKQDI